jgi:hypothetical protein
MGSRPTAMGLPSWHGVRLRVGHGWGSSYFGQSISSFSGGALCFGYFYVENCGWTAEAGCGVGRSHLGFGLVWCSLVSRFSMWTVRFVRREYAYETAVGLISVGEKRSGFFF